MLKRGKLFFTSNLNVSKRKNQAPRSGRELCAKRHFLGKEESFVWRGPGPGRIQALVLYK
jgi:hypothetical protein